MRSYLFSNVQKFRTPCAMTLILYWNIINFNLKMLCKGLLITQFFFCNLITADVMPGAREGVLCRGCCGWGGSQFLRRNITPNRNRKSCYSLRTFMRSC